MNERLKEMYRSLVARRAHAWLLYVTVATILLVSIGGVVSSTTLGLLIVLGLLTLSIDRSMRKILLEAGGLRPLVILLAFALLWQGLGIILRSPPDLGAISDLGSALAIAMLLPVLIAAMQYDTEFRDRLLMALFVSGCVAAFISIGRHLIVLGSSSQLSLQGIMKSRLIPIGRASHPILGAGGLAASLFAGLAVYPEASRRQKWLCVIGLVLIILAIALTQSRGPMVGIGLAVTAVGILGLFRAPMSRTRAALVMALLCFAIPVGLIVTEPWIKDLACTAQISLCRPSNRQDVWFTVLGLIQERPWFGIGPAFRFPGNTVPHPHNGLLGVVFYFGLPMAMLFIGIIAFVVRRAAAAPPSADRTFALLGIFFSMSFVASDLPNPFAFVNTLYLYLWLPVFIGATLGYPDLIRIGHEAVRGRSGAPHTSRN